MPGSNFHSESDNPAISKWLAEFRTKNNLTSAAAAEMMDESPFVVFRCSMSREGTGTDTDLRPDHDETTEFLGSLENHLASITGQLTVNTNGEALRSAHMLVVKNPKFNSAG